MGPLSLSRPAAVKSKTHPEVCREQGERHEGGPVHLVAIAPVSREEQTTEGAEASGGKAQHLSSGLCWGQRSWCPSRLARS